MLVGQLDEGGRSYLSDAAPADLIQSIMADAPR